jgi:hypothetical protein
VPLSPCLLPREKGERVRAAPLSRKIAGLGGTPTVVHAPRPNGFRGLNSALLASLDAPAAPAWVRVSTLPLAGRHDGAPRPHGSAA